MEPEDLESADRCARRNGLSRNAYINRAVRLLNRIQARRALRDELIRESARTSKESMAVLAEFEALEDDILE